MAKQFKIHFKNSDHVAVVSAHHFEPSRSDPVMDFYKDEKQVDAEIYVRLDCIAAITPMEPPSPPRTSSSSRSLG